MIVCLYENDTYWRIEAKIHLDCQQIKKYRDYARKFAQNKLTMYAFILSMQKSQIRAHIRPFQFLVSQSDRQSVIKNQTLF